MSLGTWILDKFRRPSFVEAPEKLRFNELEFVLLDADLSGTNVSQDSVIGVAALPLVDGVFRPDDLLYCSFDPAIKNEAKLDPKVICAYQRIVDLIKGRLIVTINPNFIRHMLEQTAVKFQLPQTDGVWLDLAAAAKTIGSETVPSTSLSQWQKKMKTSGRYQHDAVYDVFAMAQLLQALLAYAEDSGIETLGDLMRNQSAESWMRPH